VDQGPEKAGSTGQRRAAAEVEPDTA